MNLQDLPQDALGTAAEDVLTPLLHAPLRAGRVDASSSPSRSAGTSVQTGRLLALEQEGPAAIVEIAGKALRSRSIVDLHAAQIGKEVILAYENGDVCLPIVMGVLRDTIGWPLKDRPSPVQVEADGERLVVNAKAQLVLSCGQASITLTKAGKILLRGTYVLSHSSGRNRISGGSVELN